MSLSPRLLNDMITTANTSTISFKLAATILKGSKQVGSIHCNSDRMYCRGKVCPSLHAEASALLSLCGKSLRYSDSEGWCVLRDNPAKVAKVS